MSQDNAAAPVSATQTSGKKRNFSTTEDADYDAVTHIIDTLSLSTFAFGFSEQFNEIHDEIADYHHRRYFNSELLIEANYNIRKVADWHDQSKRAIGILHDKFNSGCTRMHKFWEKGDEKQQPSHILKLHQNVKILEELFTTDDQEMDFLSDTWFRKTKKDLNFLNIICDFFNAISHVEASMYYVKHCAHFQRLNFVGVSPKHIFCFGPKVLENFRYKFLQGSACNFNQLYRTIDDVAKDGVNSYFFPISNGDGDDVKWNRLELDVTNKQLIYYETHKISTDEDDLTNLFGGALLWYRCAMMKSTSNNKFKMNTTEWTLYRMLCNPNDTSNDTDSEHDKEYSFMKMIEIMDSTRAGWSYRDYSAQHHHLTSLQTVVPYYIYFLDIITQLVLAEISSVCDFDDMAVRDESLSMMKAETAATDIQKLTEDTNKSSAEMRKLNEKLGSLMK